MYRRNFVLMVSAALVVEVPQLVLALLAGSYRSFGFFFNAFSNLGNPNRLDALAPPQSNVAFVFLGYAVALLLAPLGAGLIIRITTDVAMGRPTSLLSALRGTLARYPAIAVFLLATVLAAGAVVLLVLAVVVAGIALGTQGGGNPVIIVFSVLLGLALFGLALVAGAWLGVKLVVAVPAMLEERLGPIAAIRRSWNLVTGNFWRILGIVIVVYLLATVVTYALAAVTGVASFLIPGLSGDARGAIYLVLTTLVGAVTTPIYSITFALLYFDLRVRKEALDLDQLAGSVGPPPPPPPPPPPSWTLPPPQAGP